MYKITKGNAGEDAFLIRRGHGLRLFAFPLLAAPFAALPPGRWRWRSSWNRRCHKGCLQAGQTAISG